MVRSVRARIGVALSLSLLAMAALVAPTSAAAHIRWVDNDSKKGDGPAACDHATFHTIQAAVDASAPGDKVFVCPGKYHEQLIIDTPDIVVRAKPAHGATLVPPEAADLQEVDDGFDLVDILADGVGLVGFKMNIPAGGLNPTVLPETCMELDSAVYSTGQNVLLKGNLIRTIGDDSYSGNCGYDVGIGLVNPDNLPVASGVTSGFGAQTSLVTNNRIVNFKFAGILALGDLQTQIYRNSVRFVHANDPQTCELTPVLGVKADLTFPCNPPTVAATKQYDGIFGQSSGIVAEGGLTDVRGNSVYSTFDFAVSECPCEGPVVLDVGIGLIEAQPGSIARNNRVDNVFVGMVVGEDESLPGVKASALPTAPDGSQVTGNRLNEGFIGLAVTGSNNVFYGNRAHLNFGGAVVEFGEDNVFDSNDFRYNYEGDCIDETSGSGTLNTANNWDAPNLGGRDEPDGLCIDAEVGPI